MRKPRKPKETKTAITKEIGEDKDISGDETKKSKYKNDKVSFKKEISFLYFVNLHNAHIFICVYYSLGLRKKKML